MGGGISVDSHSAAETQRFGVLLGEELCRGDVLGLVGPLGAGKTCLVQGIARGIGVDAKVPVTSPTFVLVAEYTGRLPFRHADFYRVEDYGRLVVAGFEDLLDSDGVLVVEWPERFPEALPEERLEVLIELVSASERRISLGGKGERAAELARKVMGKWH